MQREPSRDTLDRVFEAIRATALSHAKSARELDANLTSAARRIASVDFAQYDPHEVARRAHGMMVGLSDMRMLLRDEIATWQRKGLMTREVQKALRDLIRISRYATDMLGEIAIGHRTLGDGERTWRAFSGPDFNTLGHPSIPSGAAVDFEAGDVLLMRGMAANSGAIARIGDVDSQYSHVGIVHTDRRGRQFVTEALIEDGAVVKPLDEVLSEGLGRCVVFRHKDASLAARAGAMIHDYVQRSLTSGMGRNIVYDFSMELKGYKRLFCSKLVRQAFDMASDGKVLLPTYKTSLFMKNRDFFNRIGVTATETFAPGDMEIEPDFKMVAEWADYRVTSDLRLIDLTMDRFFAWMDAEQYRFKETLAVNLISGLGRFASILSPDAKTLISDVVPKTPIHMRRRTIATIVMLHKTTQTVVEELRRHEQSRKAETGRPLHPTEVWALIEAIRAREGGVVGYLAPA